MSDFSSIFLNKPFAECKTKVLIDKGYFEDQSLASFPDWDIIMGLQFENLILNNRKLIWQELRIYSNEMLSDNPFFQRKTQRTMGCQIDYMIHTRYNTLYVCEVKFSKNLSKKSVIAQMKRKIGYLSYPKGFSCRPVLIHVNGVEESIVEEGYFSNIIDFSKFLVPDT